ncbi:4-(cytidine 5'-diphospho)-2-C-methyl-D-erythritol kinase [Candidatus Contubernalis alkaliaceticus]|uniref:4-(cytidine 5'-diphospho)-2-C-methyl-D-erythritol kinase n=1 Tax=Candidatus Contubernalis alkaliaceticus TaxID=338645 RepID=UPI001F4C4DB2|nr:4-(cytidine 5'-diphospho)-2-C-methyl-D-erythritol kinase [Candidatus Contubernalis alkalaceticus]UNC90693.1 4-(cytidine 5'-diphospho)-2-C-methyl-D-erythritol kinase [Candidatus Contubernalis alkalaceticus]
MDKIYFPARAKINLSLDVLAKRPDGYHQVEMVMQSIELADMLTFTFRKGSEVLFTCSHLKVPSDDSNIIMKAVRRIREETGTNKGVSIHLEKRIPVAAGLAGGSTDAAAALLALNTLWDLGLSGDKLLEIGAELGADIPFCMKGGTCLARGKGEELTLLSPLRPMWVLLVVFPISVSTAEIYGHFRLMGLKGRPDTSAVIKALEKGDLPALKISCANVLESVTLERYPQIAKKKRDLLKKGFSGTLMTGSGPTLFYLSSERNEVERAVEALSLEEEEYIITRTI